MSEFSYPALGTAVVYIGSKGTQKLGFVTGTPATVKEGTSLPVPTEGTVHLVVWEISVLAFVPKLSVPSLEQVADNPEFQNEDGVTVNCWRLQS